LTIIYEIDNHQKMDDFFQIQPNCYNPECNLSLQEEATNQVTISRARFRDVMEATTEGELPIYELVTPSGRIPISFRGTHSEGDHILYTPEWIWNLLKGESKDVICLMEPIKPSMARMIALEPHTSDLLKCKDPETALRNAFEQYTCIRKGGSYPLQLEDLPDVLWVTIPSTTPDSSDSLCIQSVELVVDMLPARDAPPEPPTPVTVATNSAAATVTTAVVPQPPKRRFQKDYFTGEGRVLGRK
jgi:hypothetical protein